MPVTILPGCGLPAKRNCTQPDSLFQPMPKFQDTTPVPHTADQMFDLVADPMEKAELDVSSFPIGRRYSRILLGQFLGATARGDWLSAEQKGGTQLRRENAEMDDTIRDQLRALGYAN